MRRSFEESQNRAFRFYVAPYTTFFYGALFISCPVMYACCEHPSFWKLHVHRINIHTTYELSQNFAIDCMNISFTPNLNATRTFILLEIPDSLIRAFISNPENPSCVQWQYLAKIRVLCCGFSLIALSWIQHYFRILTFPNVRETKDISVRTPRMYSIVFRHFIAVEQKPIA